MLLKISLVRIAARINKIVYCWQKCTDSLGFYFDQKVFSKLRSTTLKTAISFAPI